MEEVRAQPRYTLLPLQPRCPRHISSPSATPRVIAPVREQTHPVTNPWKTVGLSFSTERVHFFGILDVRHS